jgi:hypothetical protein
MKRFFLFFFFVFALHVQSKELFVKGTYYNNPFVSQTPVKIIWNIVFSGDKLSFFLKGELKSQVFFNKDNSILSITTYKKVKGKVKSYTVSGKAKIVRELSSSFIPYHFVITYLKPEQYSNKAFADNRTKKVYFEIIDRGKK